MLGKNKEKKNKKNKSKADEMKSECQHLTEKHESITNDKVQILSEKKDEENTDKIEEVQSDEETEDSNREGTSINGNTQNESEVTSDEPSVVKIAKNVEDDKSEKEFSDNEPQSASEASEEDVDIEKFEEAQCDEVTENNDCGEVTSDDKTQKSTEKEDENVTDKTEEVPGEEETKDSNCEGTSINGNTQNESEVTSDEPSDVKFAENDSCDKVTSSDGAKNQENGNEEKTDSNLVTEDTQVNFKKMNFGEPKYDMWKEIDGRYVFGELGNTFYQKPFPPKKIDDNQYHKFDLAADVYSIGSLLVMGASVRGEAHYGFKDLRQDSFTIESISVDDGNFIFVAIADGVSDAVFSDELSEYLVNYTGYEVRNLLASVGNIHKIDYKNLAETIWKSSCRFCVEETGSKNVEGFLKYKSTLEFVIVEVDGNNRKEFVHVSVCGDGSAYLIKNNEWYSIKSGKDMTKHFVKNEVDCLPEKPKNLTVKFGKISDGDLLFIVTDGLGEKIEESPCYRTVLGEKLKNAYSIQEFVKIISINEQSMFDDKTGILIKFAGDYYDK